MLERCLPGALHYMEVDGRVQHMMDAPSPLPNAAAARAAQTSNANIPAAATNATVLQPILNPHNNSQGSAGTAGAASTVTAGVQQQRVPGSLPLPSLAGAGVIGEHNQALQGAKCLSSIAKVVDKHHACST